MAHTSFLGDVLADSVKILLLRLRRRVATPRSFGTGWSVKRRSIVDLSSSAEVFYRSC